MASSSRSDNASTQKRSSKDKANNKNDSDGKNIFSSNSNGAENDFAPPTFSSDLTPPPPRFGTIQLTDSMCLVVDLPIDETQLHPSHKDESTDEQAQKDKSEEVLEKKAQKESAQEKEIAAKQQKKAQVEENIQVMAKRLRYVFGDGSRTYTPRKRLCDVFGDGSRKSSIEKSIPIKQPTRIVNVAYNKNDEVPTENDTHPHCQTLITNEMHSHPHSLDFRSPGIRLSVDLPIDGAQLHSSPVTNKDGSTDDQSQKGKSKKILEKKANTETAQEREIVVTATVAAKQQKEAQIEKNIHTMAKRLRYVFGDGSRTYTPRKRLCDVFGNGPRTSQPIKTVNTAYNEKDQVPARKDTHPHQLLCGNRMHFDQNSYYSRISPIKLTVDLPICSSMATTTQGREVAAAVVTSEEGSGDNIAEEQQARVREAPNASVESYSAIRGDVVPVVKFHRPDLNFLPPEKDDEDYYC